MSKDRDPYICDAPGCGKRRGSDANHWWLVRFARMLGNSPIFFIEIIPWNPALADDDGTDHACGIDCMTKIAANRAAKLVDAAKGAANGAQS